MSLSDRLDFRITRSTFVAIQTAIQFVPDLLELVTDEHRQQEGHRLRHYVRRQEVETEAVEDDTWSQHVRRHDVSTQRSQHEVHIAVAEKYSVDEKRRTERDQRPHNSGVDERDSAHVFRAVVTQRHLGERVVQRPEVAGRVERRLRHGALHHPDDVHHLVEQRQTELVARREHGQHSNDVEPQNEDDDGAVDRPRFRASARLVPTVTAVFRPPTATVVETEQLHT